MTAREKDIEAILVLAKACGLEEDGLSEKLNNSEGTYIDLSVEKIVNGSMVPVTPVIRQSAAGRLYLEGYEVQLRQAPESYEYFINLGIDTRELHARLARIDWQQHPGHRLTRKEAAKDPLYGEMYKALADMSRFSSDYGRRNEEYQYLIRNTVYQWCRQFFAGTPVEKCLLDEGEYNRIMFYHPYRFPPGVQAIDAINYINELVRSGRGDILATREGAYKHMCMNLNNLDNLKAEMKQLGFSENSVKAMEENMQKNLPEFTLHEKVNGNKGQVDVNIPFRQSSQSEYYYLNKYTVALNTGKPLEEGHKYMVISPNPTEPGKNLFRSFQQVGEAITYFKEQKGKSELVSGKDAAHTTTLASMENGKVNFVAKDFQRTFRASAITQTIYVEHGKGFTMQQAANLIQGRSVYRDDLLSAEKGPYQAWVKLNMDKPKDRFQNFAITNYHDPAYGFHLEQVLDKYNIRELNDPAKRGALITALHNGDRPLITTVQNGQEVKLHLEAVPRYQQVSLYREDGKPEKREQFLKEPIQGIQLNRDQNKGKEKGKDQSEGLEQ